MISSRSIADLHPKVRELAAEFIQQALAKEGADVIITSTYRDFEAQNKLYEQGRQSPGSIVTNAKAGDSFHNYRLAFDFAPVVNGKVPWDDSALFTRLGIIGESLGLDWAGRWTGSLREMAHLQWTGGLTLAELKSGEMPATELA
jgi:peptidoglycan L-alanyl-D-glutamate endopeptidase CwlK